MGGAATSSPTASSRERSAIVDFVADIPTTPLHPSFAAVAEVAADVSELDAPVLLAWGERDPVFHLGFAADLRRRLPQAELHRFPLAGHLVVEEEDVAALADAWIGRMVEPGQAAPVAVGRSAATEPPTLWAALVAREEDDATAVAVGGGDAVSFASLAQRVADDRQGTARGRRRPG